MGRFLMAQSEARTVFIVDDDELVRESIASWLKNESYVTVCFNSSESFLALLATLPPGCVLLDIQMPGINGLGVLQQAQPHLATHPVIVMTGHGDVATAVQTMKLGAIDFIEKPCRRPLIMTTLEMAFQKLDGVLAGEPDHIEALRLVGTLSPREREVMFGLMNGHSNKALANLYDLSPRTVEMHRANMMKRLGVKTLSEALRLGFLADLRSLERTAQ